MEEHDFYDFEQNSSSKNEGNKENKKEDKKGVFNTIREIRKENEKKKEKEESKNIQEEVETKNIISEEEPKEPNIEVVDLEEIEEKEEDDDKNKEEKNNYTSKNNFYNKNNNDNNPLKKRRYRYIDNGKVMYIANKENNQQIYDIYLNQRIKFDSKGFKNPIKKWSVEIFSEDFDFLGIGLGDMNLIRKNKFRFLGLNNGIYCLYTVYNDSKHLKEVYAWNPRNQEINEIPIDFPIFEKGTKIELTYNISTYELEFKNLTEENSKYTINNIYLDTKDENTFIACCIFQDNGTKVLFSKLNECKS